jgi:hypothetical protein
MAAGADISAEVPLERGAEFRQVRVAVDAAELMLGIDIPAAPQRRAICPYASA